MAGALDHSGLVPDERLNKQDGCCISAAFLCKGPIEDRDDDVPDPSRRSGSDERIPSGGAEGRVRGHSLPNPRFSPRTKHGLPGIPPSPPLRSRATGRSLLGASESCASACVPHCTCTYAQDASWRHSLHKGTSTDDFRVFEIPGPAVGSAPVHDIPAVRGEPPIFITDDLPLGCKGKSTTSALWHWGWDDA